MATHRITAEILKATLANKYEAHPKDVQIKSYDVTGGSNKGDGYVCEMKVIKVSSKIRGAEYDDNFIAKCTPMNKLKAEFVERVIQVKNISELNSLKIPMFYFSHLVSCVQDRE